MKIRIEIPEVVALARAIDSYLAALVLAYGDEVPKAVPEYQALVDALDAVDPE